MPPSSKHPKPTLDHLDETARREVEQAQAAMRELIARIPRDFSYEDELGLVFVPERAG